jgi:hypothetical protein
MVRWRFAYTGYHRIKHRENLRLNLSFLVSRSVACGPGDIGLGILAGSFLSRIFIKSFVRIGYGEHRPSHQPFGGDDVQFIF